MFESPWHWAVVIVIGFILFFGWKQLPDMARSAGRSLRIFKTEMKGMTQDEKERAEAEAPRQLPPAEVVRNEDAARPRPRPAPNAASKDASGSD
jgi:sec-independent protein translocase protein TatA